MNAKEAKIIQEAGLGPIIKAIRKAVESSGYDNYMELRQPFKLTDDERAALKELGYTLQPYIDMDGKDCGGVVIRWD